MTITDNELAELARLSMPRLPLLDHTHSEPGTLVSVSGEQCTLDECGVSCHFSLFAKCVVWRGRSFVLNDIVDVPASIILMICTCEV